ncbi:hypothetical protein [Mucilaginibacter sp. UYCu711]
MATLFRFPPVTVDPTDPTYLTGKSEAFAKLKIESNFTSKLGTEA